MNAATEGVKLNLVDASIEQIEQAGLAELNAQGGEQANPAGEAKDVSAPSGQAQDEKAAAEAKAQAEAKPAESDKDKNFAALRTKLQHAEETARKLQAENERLAAERAAATPDVKAQVAEADAKLASLGEQFEGGDITWDEYQKQLKETTAQRESLIAEAAKATAREEVTRENREKELREAKESADRLWADTSSKFIGANPDGVDYNADEGKFNDLNTIIKALASDPDSPANGLEPEQRMEWFLQTAHAAVKAKHGIATAQKPAEPAKPAEKPAAKPAAPINSLSDVPGGLPPARTEIEQLEQVSGAALTNRFSKMSSAEIDKELAKLG